MKLSRDWLPVLAVAGIAFAASLAGITNQFVQDDVVLILQNDRLHHLANWREILTSSYWPAPWNQELYRPITSLLLAAEFELGAGHPLIYRIASDVLYAASAAGVYLLASRLLTRPVAIGVALLFAAHPIHVEAVALGVGQSELLVGLLATLMTALYLRRRREDGLRVRDWIILVMFYVTASMVKEQGFLLPAILLAAEVFLLSGSTGPPIRRLAPGYAALAGAGLLLVVLRLELLGGQFARNFTAEALEGLTPMGRALTMLTVVPHWIRLSLWPAHLQADYSPGEILPSTGFGLTEALGLFLLVAIAAAAWLGRRRAPVFSFGIAWTAIALLPVSNVLVSTGVVLAERTLYLPSVGVVLAIGGLVELLAGSVGSVRHHGLRTALAVVAAALVVAGIVRSAERQQVWKNERELSMRSAVDAPKSYRMQTAAAYTLFEAGQREEGIKAYRRAIALAPIAHLWRVQNDLARRYFAEGNLALAVGELQASLSVDPDQEETWNYLVLANLAQGAYADAARHAEEAMARGGSVQLFGGLRTLADSAARAGAPPGSIRIRVVPGPPPQ